MRSNSNQKEFHYISAGHEPCIIQRGDQQTLLNVTGPAIGIFETANYAAETINLWGGEYLIAYSDGLVDAQSPLGEKWGRAALLSHLKSVSTQELTAKELLSFLAKTVKKHTSGTEPFDDLTLMVVHVRSRPSIEWQI